jgi:type I restriction enzyme S subunit
MSPPLQNWDTKTLGELIDAIRQPSKIEKTKTYELWSIPSFSDGAPEIILGSEIGSSKLKVMQNDILISKINPRINRVWIVEDSNLEQLASPEWLVARIKDSNEIDKKFLLFYLSSPEFRDWISRAASSVTGSHSRAKANEILQRDIPLPPMDEQHKIVELLEDNLSRLDDAIEDVKQAKLKSNQFRRSLLQAAFTGKLNSAGTQLMTEWQTKKVGELADTQLGKMLNKSKQTGENTIPYLRSVNVQWGRVDTSDLNQMDILPNELEKFTVKKGDLLICEGGESGRVAIWDKDEPIGFQNALHRVRSKNEVINKYLYYYFEWLVKNQLIEHLFNGVTIKHFPQENLRSVEMSYPPIGEQHKIVELLEDHLSRLEASVSLVDAMEKQSIGLRRSLLQAAFTGQLTKEVESV